MKQLLFTFIVSILTISIGYAQLVHPQQIGTYSDTDPFLGNRTGVGVGFHTLEQLTTAGTGITITGNTISVDQGAITGDGVVTGLTITGANTKTFTLTRSNSLPNLTGTLDLTPYLQTITAGGTTSPTLTVGAGTVTFAGAGGLTLSRSGSTITLTAPTAAADKFLSAAAFTGTGTSRNYTFTVSNGTNVTGTINVDDGDASSTNEVNVLGRAANANTVTSTNGGGSVSVSDIWHEPVITATAGQSVFVFPAPPAGSVPAAAELRIYLNGVQAPEGVDGTDWTWNSTTRTLTYTVRNLSAGEKVKIAYVLQN